MRRDGHGGRPLSDEALRLRGDPDALAAALADAGSDDALADQLGVARRTVIRWRRHHDIEPAQPDGRHGHPLTDMSAWDLVAALVDAGSADALAVRVGVTQGSVLRACRRQGIVLRVGKRSPDTSPIRRLPDAVWDEAAARVRQAQEASDQAEGQVRQEVADTLGVTRQTVTRQVRRRGVASAKGRPPTYTPEQRAKVVAAVRGGMPIGQAADLVGASYAAVHDWIDSDDSRGGRTGDAAALRDDPEAMRQALAEHGSDRAVGRAHGVDIGTVAYWRRGHGIPPCNLAGSNLPAALAELRDNPEVLRAALVERGCDRALAEAHGVTATTIYRWRTAHGLPVARELRDQVLDDWTPDA